MKILLYQANELEERVSKKFKVWKAWHITLYVLIAVFGIINFTLLQKTKELVDDKCVFYPVILEFHMVVKNATDDKPKIKLNINNARSTQAPVAEDKKNNKLTVVDKEVYKREINSSQNEDDTLDYNDTDIDTGNTSHLMLQTDRTLFGDGTDCEFAEYMPILSTIFAVVWITMFTMCPSGGRSRSGLQQPWRIIAPALIFALVMVGFTGLSFGITNGGLHAFCASFYNVTNTTMCSAVDPFLERSAGVEWGFGRRAAATRAACAGVWAGWACAAVLLFARCLAAPDFALRRTGIYLTSDPQQKIVPSLKKNSSRASRQSRRAQDDASVRSEPTLTSQLVSVEQGAGDSAPTSLITTPVREPNNAETLELTQTPGPIKTT